MTPAEVAEAVQDAREEAETRNRRKNPCAPTASSRAAWTALGLYLRGNRDGAAWFLRRAAGTLRRSFYDALEETDYQRERAEKQAAARAAGATCLCGAPALWIQGPGNTGPCEDYPCCGLYEIGVDEGCGDGEETIR